MPDITAPVTVPSSSHAGRWESALMGNYATPRLLFESGRGPYLYAADGSRYLDLLGGLAVNAVGHCHPRVVQAVQEQAARLAHVSNLYATEPALRLAERLAALTGGRKALFSNSGAEANEAAFKLVRRHAHATGRPGGVIVSFDGSFHGRTMATVTLTGQATYQERFEPLMQNVVRVPYNDPAALEAVFAQHPVVGVFAECVQGEGGVIPLQRDVAALLARLTRANDALLVVDEVQTGMGRTGRLFAYEHFGWEPDIITVAKALGGGYPIGVMLARPGLASLLGPGSHGTTFGGNPVSCAAANAVLDVFAEEALVPRAARLGESVAATLREGLQDVGVTPRGLGLLVGLPLKAPVAPQIVQVLEAKRILIGQAGKTVARLAPPLIIDEDLLAEALPQVTDAVRSALAPA